MNTLFVDDGSGVSGLQTFGRLSGFDGFGPTLAADVSIPFKRRAAFYANARVSYLFGEIDGSESIGGGGNLFTSFRNPGEDRTLRVLEGGIRFQYDLPRARLRIGWESEVWEDAGIFPSGSDDVSMSGLAFSVRFRKKP